MVLARVGERHYNHNYRSKTKGAHQLGFGPGSLYMIDSTKLDIYLRSALSGRIVERPVFYAIIDAFSQMITGFYLGLRHASWEAAKLALDVAFAEKVTFAADMGYPLAEEDWPCEGIPAAFLHDGGEMASKAATKSLVEGLGLSLGQTPPYRADWKGQIENVFNIVNKAFLHDLPGAVDKDWQRGDRDYRLESALTIEELQVILIAFIVNFNRNHHMKNYPLTVEMLQDGVDPFPIDLWNWGIQNRTGKLKTLSRDVVRLHLLPGGEATITSKGILFRGNYYTTPRAEEEKRFDYAEIWNSRRVPVAYDPRDAGVIYLREATTRTLEVCTPTERTIPAYRDREWWEIEMAEQDLQIRRSRRKEQEAQDNAHLHAVIDKAVQTAQDRKKSRGPAPSKASELKNIREATQIDREVESREQAWRLPGEAPLAEEISTQSNPNPSPSRKAGKMDRFRRVVEGGKEKTDGER